MVIQDDIDWELSKHLGEPALVNKGGQNIMEPAAFALPVVFGPYMHNFKQAKEIFLRENAAIMVDGEKELKNTITNLINDGQLRRDLGANAKRTIEINKGATAKAVNYIMDLVK